MAVTDGTVLFVRQEWHWAALAKAPAFMPVSGPIHSTEPKKRGVLRYRWPARTHTRHATLRLFRNSSFLNVSVTGYPASLSAHPIVTVCVAPVAILRQFSGTRCQMLPDAGPHEHRHHPHLPFGLMGPVLHELQSRPVRTLGNPCSQPARTAFLSVVARSA